MTRPVSLSQLVLVRKPVLARTHTHTFTCQHTCNTNPEYLALQTAQDHRLCRFCANVMPNFRETGRFLSRYGSGVDAGGSEVW